MVSATGRKYGSCPIGGVGEFHGEHWDADSLCSMFGCRACVADPGGLGCHDPDEEPLRPRRAARDRETPFWEATRSARVRAQTRRSLVHEPESSRDETRKSDLTKYSMRSRAARPSTGARSPRAPPPQGAIGAPAYLCLPRHPRQRGTNENANGLLRDFFPKGRSLDGVSDEEVREAYHTLNRRPRKRLGWKCPWEVYHHKSLHLL